MEAYHVSNVLFVSNSGVASNAVAAAGDIYVAFVANPSEVADTVDSMGSENTADIAGTYDTNGSAYIDGTAKTFDTHLHSCNDRPKHIPFDVLVNR